MLQERKQDSRWNGQPPLTQLRSLLVLPLDRLEYYIRTLRQVCAFPVLKVFSMEPLHLVGNETCASA